MADEFLIAIVAFGVGIFCGVVIAIQSLLDEFYVTYKRDNPRGYRWILIQKERDDRRF